MDSWGDYGGGPGELDLGAGGAGDGKLEGDVYTRQQDDPNEPGTVTPGPWSRRLDQPAFPAGEPVGPGQVGPNIAERARQLQAQGAPAHYVEPGAVSNVLGILTARPHLTALAVGLAAYWLTPAKHRWTAAAFGLAGGYVLAAFVLPKVGSAP